MNGSEGIHEIAQLSGMFPDGDSGMGTKTQFYWEKCQTCIRSSLKHRPTGPTLDTQNAVQKIEILAKTVQDPVYSDRITKIADILKASPQYIPYEQIKPQIESILTGKSTSNPTNPASQLAGAFAGGVQVTLSKPTHKVSKLDSSAKTQNSDNHTDKQNQTKSKKPKWWPF